MSTQDQHTRQMQALGQASSTWAATSFILKVCFIVCYIWRNILLTQAAFYTDISFRVLVTYVDYCQAPGQCQDDCEEESYGIGSYVSQWMGKKGCMVGKNTYIPSFFMCKPLFHVWRLCTSSITVYNWQIRIKILDWKKGGEWMKMMVHGNWDLG